MSKTRVTVPVSERALIQRINRKLAMEDRRLLVNRGAEAREDLGHYCVVNGMPDFLYVFERHVDLEALGRKVGALAQWERLAKPRTAEH